MYPEPLLAESHISTHHRYTRFKSSCSSRGYSQTRETVLPQPVT